MFRKKYFLHFTIFLLILGGMGLGVFCYILHFSSFAHKKQIAHLWHSTQRGIEGFLTPHQPSSLEFSQEERAQLLSEDHDWLKGARHYLGKGHYPAPLRTLSEDEKQSFPDAKLVEYAVVPGPHDGEVLHLRLLKTFFKYPNIRTEELVDQKSGQLLGRREMVADRFLVTLPPGQDPKNFLDFFKRYGGKGGSILFANFSRFAKTLEPVMPKEGVYALQLPVSQQDGKGKEQSLLQEFTTIQSLATKNQSEVKLEPDIILHLADVNDEGKAVSSLEKINRSSEKELIPPGFFVQDQWSLWKEHLSFDAKETFHGINAPEGWKVRTSAENIIVAILDTGIDYTHPNLAPNIWVNPSPTQGDLFGWNAYDESNNPKDSLFHGTMCAGIIGAAPLKGVGISGIAWKVQLMACRFLDDEGIGTFEDSLKAANYAVDHGAQVINMSFGAPFLGALLSPSMLRMMRKCYQANAVVVVAAGNESGNNDSFWDADYPAGFHFDNVIVVASLSQKDELSSFSNYGKRMVDIAAPGEAILSTELDHHYMAGDGTSFATPQVAGAVALLKAQYPNATPKELIDHLCKTSKKLPSLKGKIRSGLLDLGKALTTRLSVTSNDTL